MSSLVARDRQVERGESLAQVLRVGMRPLRQQLLDRLGALRQHGLMQRGVTAVVNVGLHEIDSST